MKIFLIGFMGCGKSYWGQQLAERLKMKFVDLDSAIEESEGKSIADIFREEGEENFRSREKEVLYQTISDNVSFVMATGGGSPCFYNNIDLMKKSGVVVWVNCSMETVFQRLRKEKEHRPLISQLDDDQLKQFIFKKYSGRKVFYQQASVILPEENLTLEILLNSIFHAKQ